MINEQQNIICIGDIHSCSEEFKSLLKRLYVDGFLPEHQKTRIVLVGDLFDRGPDPVEVYKTVRQLKEIEVVRGNHCEKLFRYYRKKFSGEKIDMKLGHGLKETIEAFENTGLEWEVYSWLGTLPYFIKIGSVLITHGAWKEGVSEGQLKSLNLFGETTGQKTSDGYPARSDNWKYDYNGELTHIVVGHSIFKEPQVVISKSGCKVVSIDLGCFQGGRLCAYVLPQEHFVYEKARKNYWK